MTDKSRADLIIHSASQLLTLSGGPQRGGSLGDLGIIEDGAIAVADGDILAVGSNDEIQRRFIAQRTIDAGGSVVLPGFVDPHTHLIFAGDRAAEFEMRIAGASYMEIMDAGGGIISTVKQTRAASIESLVTQARLRLNHMLAHGTTTAEAKTGYGLELETELKMLQAILLLNDEGPIELAPTFLGAHALPPEYADAGEEGYEAYTVEIVEQMLPAVKRWWTNAASGEPFPFVDVFCETGAFNLSQSRRILARAKEIGFPLKIHADEFDGLGGTGLAVELGAASADHLVQTPPEDIAALGQSDTVAVALPCTPFGLAEREYTPAKSIIEAGGILALATDLNPGTAWCESMQMAIALACRYMKLTPAQAIAASTVNSAAAIQRTEILGSIESGKQADILVLSVSDYRHLGYRFGTNLVSVVIKNGELVFPDS
ncbi:MAG: imidazolonepropionase [Chloroflexi bacterium]|nr:imidazolonepropionase [Chloroflexota bacterium]